MPETGWYMCPNALNGTVFGFWHDVGVNWQSYPIHTFLGLIEVMVYTQEAIQLNALSSTIISGY